VCGICMQIHVCVGGYVAVIGNMGLIMSLSWG